MQDSNKITNYAGHLIVKARILARKPSWLIVRTDDGKRGIIPKKEWSWSRSRAQEPLVFREGDSIRAVLLPDAFKSGYAHLSIRELENPWENAANEFSVGEKLLCEVVNLRNNAAFVEVYKCYENGQFLPVPPGITAILWAGDLPMLAHQVPADVLSLGDRIFAVITRIEPDKKRMWVSVNEWMQGLELHESAQKEYLESIFKPVLDRLGFEEAGQTPVDVHKIIDYKVSPLTQLRKILIIDDNPKDRAYLIRHLRRSFSVDILEADTGKKGLDLLEKYSDIDLAIIDIGLGSEEYGPEIGKKVLEKHPALHLVFASSDYSRIEELADIENETQRTFPFVHKRIQVSGDVNTADESVSEVVHLLFEGIVQRLSYESKTGLDSFMEQLGFAIDSNNAPESKIVEFLSLLSRTCLIEYTLVLALDLHTKEVSFVSGFPEEDEALYRSCLDGIYYSPVREVIEDQEILYANQISPDVKKAGRYKNFFRHLNFSTCYGIPLALAIGNVRYGLFVLDRSKDLTWESIMRIRTTASHIALTLERDKMIKALSRYQERAFMGQVFGTFVHELKNSFEVMDGDIELLQYKVANHDREGSLVKLKNLQLNYEAFKTLTNAYTRYVTEGGSMIQINDVVHKAIQQLEHKAQKENFVTIHFSPDERLLPIWGNALHVEQIVLNITLNAIQHVAAHYRKMQSIAESRGGNGGGIRRIWIKTCLCPGKKFCQISVADSGPGIPYDPSDRIFQMGVSTREDGHGLGLFISRNLAESMNGHIYLAESIRFAGSLFVINFPVSGQL